MPYDAHLLHWLFTFEMGNYSLIWTTVDGITNVNTAYKEFYTYLITIEYLPCILLILHCPYILRKRTDDLWESGPNCLKLHGL